jgi:hypothetical protein
MEKRGKEIDAIKAVKMNLDGARNLWREPSPIAVQCLEVFAELLVEVMMLGGLATFLDVCKLSFSWGVDAGLDALSEKYATLNSRIHFWNSNLEARVGVEPTLRVFETLPSLVWRRASQNFL